MRLCAELRGGRYRKKKWDNRHSAGRKKLKRDPPSITRTRERERCVSHVSVKKLSSSQMTTNLHDFLRSFDIYRSRVVNFHKTSSTQRLSIPIAAVRSKKLRATPEKFVSISMKDSEEALNFSLEKITGVGNIEKASSAGHGKSCETVSFVSHPGRPFYY